MSDERSTLHPEVLKARLLELARAIAPPVAEAERSLQAGSWKPSWESINELEQWFDKFIGDARMLHMHNTGHVFQDGQLKRED